MLRVLGQPMDLADNRTRAMMRFVMAALYVAAGIAHGSLYLNPASTETRGHLTTGNAKFYVEQLRQLLENAPQHAM